MRRWWMVAVWALALTACGGSQAPEPAAPVPTLSGTAATGVAIAGRVWLKDAAANERSVDTADGHYRLELTGLTPPYLLKVQWSDAGGPQTLYSFAVGPGTANITPLTQLVVAAAARADDLAPLYAAPNAGAYQALATALPAALADWQKALRPLLAPYTTAPVDPMADAFAADHTAVDALLDHITVSQAAGVVSVTDKASGGLLLEAATAGPAHALVLPAWSAHDSAVASDPDIAVDSKGNGLVAWTEVVDARSVLRARFMQGAGSTTTLSDSGDAGMPRLAFDAAGNACLVWVQYQDPHSDVWSRRYDAATQAWGAPVRLSSTTAPQSAYLPDLAVDDAGNALVVWNEYAGSDNHFDVWAARRDAATGSWGAASRVSDGALSAWGVRVAVNAAGQGVVAWEQEQPAALILSNGPHDVWARSVSAAGVWGPGQQLNRVGGDIDVMYGQVAVAVAPDGEALVLWVQRSGALPFVIHSALRHAGAWQASAVITDHAADNCYGPHAAFDAQGHALAVWEQQTGTSAYGASNRYTAGVGWGTSAAMASDTDGDVHDVRVAVDAEGNATAVWYQWRPSGTDIKGRRYLVGQGWSVERWIGAMQGEIGLTYPVPRVATNAAGQTMAIWGTDSN